MSWMDEKNCAGLRSTTCCEAQDGQCPEQTTDDKANPSHYARLGQYSSIHVIAAWGLGFELGNALKYIGRAGTKPGESEVDDLRKARWYINRRLHLLDPENNADPTEGPVTG